MFRHGDEVEIQGIGAGTPARPGLSRSCVLHLSTPHKLFVWRRTSHILDKDRTRKRGEPVSRLDDEMLTTQLIIMKYQGSVHFGMSERTCEYDGDAVTDGHLYSCYLFCPTLDCSQRNEKKQCCRQVSIALNT